MEQMNKLAETIAAKGKSAVDSISDKAKEVAEKAKEKGIMENLSINLHLLFSANRV